MNFEEYQFFQGFSVDFPDKDQIPRKLIERGENSSKTTYMDLKTIQNLQGSHQIFTNNLIPWQSINQESEKNLQLLEMNQFKPQNANSSNPQKRIKIDLYNTLPQKFLENNISRQRTTGIFIEPKQIAKNQQKMKYFIDQLYGNNPKQQLQCYIQHLTEVVKDLQNEKNQIYTDLQDFQQYQQNQVIQQIQNYNPKILEQNYSSKQDLEDLKQIADQFLDETKYGYNPTHHKKSITQDLLDNLRINDEQSYEIYMKNCKLIEQYKQSVQGLDNWTNYKDFLTYIKKMQSFIKSWRLKTLVKIFKKPVGYFKKIKKFDIQNWPSPELFSWYINQKGKSRNNPQVMKLKHNKIISEAQIRVIHEKLDNIQQIKSQVKKTNKDLLYDLRKQGIRDSQSSQELLKQLQLQYQTVYRAVKNCNYVQLKSSYVIQDNPQLYQIHIRERLIYCTLLSLFLSTGVELACLDEAYAHLDNGKQQMLGQKGKRVKWPQTDVQDKLGFLLSIESKKQQGIQLIKNSGFNSQDVVQFLDLNNSSLQNIQNHVFIMDNATSHVSCFTKRRILASGMMVLCNASRFPEGNPVEIIIGLMKREIPKYGLNITPQQMSESIIRSFRFIKKTWIIGAYISAYNNCIQFLQDVQNSNYFNEQFITN